jgi:arginase family enzyme
MGTMPPVVPEPVNVTRAGDTRGLMSALAVCATADAVDPVYAPSTGTRVAGGLSYREAYFLCESVASTGR